MAVAKYTPLATFLRRQKRDEIELTFRDIERIVGGILPKAATIDDWWRCDPSGLQKPQHVAFADAGFVAEPQTRAETVRFVRVTPDGRNPALALAHERDPQA